MQESLAIIGIGCRFPGANNAAEFWRLLGDGKDAIAEVHQSRWDVERFYDPDPKKPDKTNSRWGGFLERVDEFDPQFFGIAPREVSSMDPQQRLILEVAWEALEDAGMVPEQLAGTATGVFVGIGTHDYSIMLLQNPVNDPYITTGTGNCIAANRISYLLDLKGPSLAVDTACSSSLVAVHLACQSIWRGESSLALVGGVNVLLWPTITIGFTKGGFLAADGRCKSFDAKADGYVRGEGAGMILLKPLSRAVAAGDRIYAVIRGSAVNQDGFSSLCLPGSASSAPGRHSGMAAPNQAAQEAVLRAAYANAGVDSGKIQYVEAHGTGTKLGDRVEMNALGRVLGENRLPGDYCAVGSVKTNIGHAETAAGIAGLIKVALALNYKQIPPSLHFQNPNPEIDFDRLPLRVQTRLKDWPRRATPALAGVNSFGFGGTNAHVVLEAAPSSENATESGIERSHHILTLSAKSDRALQQLAQRYRDMLSDRTSVADLCFTANTRRSHFSHRLAIVTTSTEDLRAQLHSFITGNLSANCISDRAKEESMPVVFLCTGQGAQYVNMGRELYATQPTFRAAMEDCDRLCSPYLEKSLLEVIYPNNGATSCLDETAYTQPALFALEYSLAQLWMDWGIIPAAVMGHSIGEYVAACLAGVFSLADALKLIATRGRLMQKLPKNGAMVAVFASEMRVQAAINGYEKDVAIAAINGPENIVISGKTEAMESVMAKLAAEGIKTTRLKVSHAFHSPLMVPMLAEFEAIAREVTYSPPQIDLISNVTGELVSDAIATPEYWCRHIRQPVRFAASMATLDRQGYGVFIEIGPQPILLGMGRGCLATAAAKNWLPSMRSVSLEKPVRKGYNSIKETGSSDWQTMLQSLAALYVRGAKINWSAFDRDYTRHLVQLPTYPFQRQRFWWPDAEANAKGPLSRDLGNINPLLGKKLNLAGTAEIRFQSQISQNYPAYLQDHCLGDRPVFPATGYIEIALAAGTYLWQNDNLQISELAIAQPLFLEDEEKRIQVVLRAEGKSTYKFQIYSAARDNPSFTLHADGKIGMYEGKGEGERDELGNLQEKLTLGEGAIADYYRELRSQGLKYGASFQGVKQLWVGEGEALGQIQLPETLVAQMPDYQFHPALLDACLQVVGRAIKPKYGSYLPVGLESLQLRDRPGSSLWSYVQVRRAYPEDRQLLKADLRLLDAEGTIVANIEGLSLQYVSEKSWQHLLQSEDSDNLDDWLYEVAWQPQVRDGKNPASQAIHSWLIFADAKVGVELAAKLAERGDRAVLVFPGQNYAKGDGRYHVNPTQPQDFQRLLADIDWENLPGDRGVVHLWSLEEIDSQHPHPQHPHPQGWGYRNEARLRGLGTIDRGKSCATVLHLIQSLKGKLSKLWLVTRGSQGVTTLSAPLQLSGASLWGLGRVINLEHPDLHCILVDLDPDHREQAIAPLLEELDFPDSENQIAYRQGVRYGARLVRRSQWEDFFAEPKQLRISSYGNLDNFTLMPATPIPPGPGEVEIQVRAAGLNFRDVLNALGMLKQYLQESGSPLVGYADAADIPFGGECAGVIVALGENVTGLHIGDRVMAVNAIGCLGSFVTVRSEFVVPLPPDLDWAAAATIGIAFLTAYYGLHYQAKIKPGDRVLIHAAAGGVGQAAVQIAHAAGAEIFATASPGKWEFLQGVGVKHIMNSRTLDFAERVMSITEGRGVDIVLNSLNGEFIPKSIDVLAAGGRFVEIGKIGIWDAAQVQAKRPDVAYFPFDLLEISAQNPSLIANMLAAIMSEFQGGPLQPLSYQVFPIQDAAIAFRYMAQGKHIGKVVLAMPETASREIVRTDGSYLITGGLGALGLQVAHWLAEKGAPHIVLTGRSDPSPTARETIGQISQLGTQISVINADISDANEVEKIIDLYRRSGNFSTLRGVVHAAGVLQDGLLLNQHWDSFSQVMASKVAGTWHLHLATRDLPLDFFVCFSSVAAIIGSAGQGNYAAANAFMDALVRERRRLGLPGLTVNWGPWEGLGMTAKLTDRDRARMARQGMGAIGPQQGLQLLEKLLEEGAIQASVLPVDWSMFLQQLPEGVGWNFWENLQPASGQKEPQQSAFLQELGTAQTADRPLLLQSHIRAQVAQVLGFGSPEMIEVQESFADLGMDSLMAVELKNRLEASLSVTISPSLTFDYPTVEALSNYLAPELMAIDLTNLSVPELPGLENVAAKSVETTETNSQTREIPAEFYQFDRLPEYLNLKQDLTRVAEMGNPFFAVHRGIASNVTHIADRELINYASYNYLGLSGDRRISEAAQEAIDRYGTSVSASRIVSGERPIHGELEREIADLLGAEAAIVYIGGHATNVTTIGHLFGTKDLILCDALSHNSIRQGCMLSGARIMEFPHNDARSLDRLLGVHRYQYEKVLIAIEGIYSTDGDIAPLPEIIALKKHYKCFLLVDEAHSIGVLGHQGRGIGEYFAVPPTDVDLWMGTLSKSFASCGGYIAGCRELVEYLKWTAPGFVFSVGMSPPNGASALAAIKLLKAEPERVARLRDRAQLFWDLARSHGLNIGASKNSPIVPVIVGEPYKAVNLSGLLCQRGINVQPMVYPSVPYHASRLRFFITCTHTEAQIYSTMEAIAQEIAKI